MLRIIFTDGINANIEISKKEADRLIEKWCKNDKRWITLNAPNNSTTYNKDNIAMMISEEDVF
jgi:hypothetical protein